MDSRIWRTGHLGRAAALLFLTALFGCGETSEVEKIPIGQSDADLVIVTEALEADLMTSPVREHTRSEKDDHATAWEHRFEEQADPAADGVVKRRFRVTISNRSETVRSIRVDLDYRTPGTRELVRTRALRLVVVPPFTETAVSGYTQFLAERKVFAEVRAVEVRPE